jgi:uncharacterized membrane protein
MRHEMTLFEEPFNKIRDKQKSIEVRLNDEKRQNIKVGDIIRITSSRWIRMSFPLILIIIVLTIFLPNLTYGLIIFFILSALIFISIFLFNGFHLSVFDREKR